MARKILVKDFEIKSVRIGSRIQGGPEWAYQIIYNAPNGKQVRLNTICYTKEAARKHIRETIKIAEALRGSKEETK